MEWRGSEAGTVADDPDHQDAAARPVEGTVHPAHAAIENGTLDVDHIRAGKRRGRNQQGLCSVIGAKP